MSEGSFLANLSSVAQSGGYLTMDHQITQDSSKRGRFEVVFDPNRFKFEDFSLQERTLFKGCIRDMQVRHAKHGETVCFLARKVLNFFRRVIPFIKIEDVQKKQNDQARLLRDLLNKLEGSKDNEPIHFRSEDRVPDQLVQDLQLGDFNERRAPPSASGSPLVVVEQAQAIEEVTPEAAGMADLDFKRLPHSFFPVEEAEVLEKQAQVVVVNPKYGTVSLQTLHANGLLPTNKIVLGDVNIYCSKIFKVDTHSWSIALVEIENQLYPRVFYHSNSQGTWRVLPSATKVPEIACIGFFDPFLDQGCEKRVVHYGKGNDEKDIQLPIPVNLALNKLPSENRERNEFRSHEIVETHLIDSPKFLRLVTVKDSVTLREGAPEDFMCAVIGRHYGKRIPFPPNPQDINLPREGLLPDFSERREELVQTIPHYDEVKVNIFPSRDGSLLYMFYEAVDGRAFLASVEYVREVKINSFGVREQILDTKHMDAPLLEYPEQISKDCFPNDRVKIDCYMSNWNYIRELAIMKMYYAHQGKLIPEKV